MPSNEPSEPRSVNQSGDVASSARRRPSNDPVVVGGGLAGLSVAALAQAGGLLPRVLSADPEPGGVARTIVEDRLRLEPGASTLLVQEPALAQVVQWSGAQTAELAATDRWVFLGSGMKRLAPGPALLLSPPGSRRGLALALVSMLRSRPPSMEVSLSDYCSAHFGPEYGRLLSWLAASGIYAGDPTKLSAQACFAPLLQLEAQEGSLLGAVKAFRARSKAAPQTGPRSVVAVEGMADVADRIATKLGERWYPNIKVTKVAEPSEGSERLRFNRDASPARADLDGPLVWAAPIPPALFEAAPPPGGPSGAEVAVVFFSGDRSAWVPPHGMGVLVGPDVPFQTRGVLFESEYTPPGARCPSSQWLLKVIFGGDGPEPIDGLTDDQIAQRALVELRAMMGAGVSPRTMTVARRQIPQYQLGFPAWRQSVDAWALAQDIHVTGWAVAGVGVRDLARTAAQVVGKIRLQPVSS
ncbi:MAG: FAD-dependent oxidoreductase [Acidimicrobiia bacterium]|nr:FAD-dependent oxidoreductase [Acidimicrobiia bacterium]MBP8182205.1 FAD-dependent oxidoreductase [Acidimicrobiia bacterium]